MQNATVNHNAGMSPTFDIEMSCRVTTLPYFLAILVTCHSVMLKKSEPETRQKSYNTPWTLAEYFLER